MAHFHDFNLFLISERTDGLPNQSTDQWTDKPSYRDAKTLVKTLQWIATKQISISSMSLLDFISKTQFLAKICGFETIALPS